MNLLKKHHIYTGDTAFESFINVLGEVKYTKIMVLTDEHTDKHCYPLIIKYLPEHFVMTIASGEAQKNIETCCHIWQKMTEAEMDRHALVINLGGGVIGDMGGFCAATYKRGIKFITIPTTLLSMVDASVGGKLGIDFMGFKNHIGVFQEPEAVIINPVFLKTLPERELKSGYAEVIKHALIKDASMWDYLKNTNWDEILAWNIEKWDEIITHSVNIKAQIVEADPKEKGIRKILNFGHTIGHAVETYYLNTPSRLLHGEAIAIGMVIEAFLSYTKGYISENEYKDIYNYTYKVFVIKPIKNVNMDDILKYCYQDKKNNFGQLNFSILKEIGNCTFDIKISDAEIINAMNIIIS
ncbi:MAG: 3-dehydroquinate synthase [Cytophagales bacterium]|nr:3-dehydroquinate synthase [Cytophagales bacterium]